MADPFGNIFNPSRGGGFGMIGGLMGVPSDRTVIGTSQGGAQNELSQLLQTEGSPQRAVTKFLQSPSGMDLFMKDPNAADTIGNWIKNVTPPEPKIHNIPEGGMGVVMGPNGPTGERISNPTTAAQNLDKALSQFKNATDEDKQAITTAIMVPEPGQKSLALQGLVKRGTITQDAADYWKSGAIQPIEIKKPNGEGTGIWVGQNYITGEIIGGANGVNLGEGGSGLNVPRKTAPTISIPPDAKNPDGTVDPYRVFTDPREGMFFGAGPVAGTVSFMGNVLRWANPSAKDEVSEKASAWKNQLQALRASISAMPDIDGRLRIQADAWMNLVDQMGFMGEPKAAIIQGMRILNQANSAMEKERITYNDRTLPKDVQNAAARRRDAYQHVIDQLPSMDRMREMIQGLESGKSEVITPGAAVGSVVNNTVQAAKGAAEAVGTAAGAATGTEPKPKQPSRTEAESAGKAEAAQVKRMQDLKDEQVEAFGPTSPDWAKLSEPAKRAWIVRAQAAAAARKNQTATPGTSRSLKIEATEE